MGQRDTDKYPTVTAIVPARDEELTIRAAIRSVLDQDYPGSLDVVVAVGPSTDRTHEIVSDITAKTGRVTMVENPTGTTPAGLNIATAVALGEIIARCDAHAEMPAGYVTNAVRRLRVTGAVNVGGIQDAVGVGPMQRAIAAAMSSPFGVGDARFHTGGPAGFVDTVYLGVFRREALEAIGGFDETLIRNQDYELNHRLRSAGGGIYFDPALRVTYRPRSTLRDLAKQYFDYGRWKRVVLKRHPGSARLRQLIAPVFVAGLGISGIIALAGHHRVAMIIPGAYVAATLAATGFEIARRRDWAMVLLPAVYPTMHLTWGLGFLTPRHPSTRDR